MSAPSQLSLPLSAPLHGIRPLAELDAEGGYFPLYPATVCDCCQITLPAGSVTCATCAAETERTTGAPAITDHAWTPDVSGQCTLCFAPGDAHACAARRAYLTARGLAAVTARFC